jgi:GNAT superfamily N-acetyltransferase
VSAGDHLSPHQFTEMYSPDMEYRHEYHAEHFPENGSIHRVDAYREYSSIPHEHVGSLEWHTGPHEEAEGRNGEISHIEVHPEHQRQGVASSMYAMGRAMADLHGVPAPVHSSARTEAGDSWAHSVTPRAKLAPADKALRVPKEWS